MTYSGETLSGGVSQYGSGGLTNTDGTNFLWFDAIAELAGKVGTDSSIFQYWCQLCGATVQPQLINLNTISALNVPIYDCFDPDSIASVSDVTGAQGSPLCAIFVMWMYSSWWAFQTGGIENATCGPPVIPS